MLVFKILVILALVLCFVNIVLTIHDLNTAKNLIDGIQNWAVEIDRSNLNYIRQEFAKLKYENGLVLVQDDLHLVEEDSNNNENKD